MMKIYSGVYNRKGKDMNHWLSIIFRVLLPLVFIFISLTVFASSHSNVMNVPEKIIKGVVVDSLSGNPLPGVTIQIKGTSSGTTTNGKGAFQLSVSDEAVLVVSYLGYNEKKIPVNGRTDIKISLSSSATSLDQVVVIGYGSVKKKDVTGAVSKIGSEKIEKRPMKNAVQAMQGQIAGVDVSSSQRPGEVGDITIRGVRSLTASNEPLYVVDGIPLTTGGIEYLNPNDIESISVLKDASATAIYGSRGANGVVLVTTKGGEKGRFKVNYSGSVSFLKMHNLATLMNASQSIDY